MSELNFLDTRLEIRISDSGRYSADNTDEGTAEHQTSGQISEELKNWVIEQAQAATEKGNTVIGMMHHGLIEHFDMEEEFLADYLVNDYQNISAAFADAGIHYVFTGHMHANDIAAMTTAAGNELYDIETGSAVTYPCPMRFVSFSSTTEGSERTIKADIDTVMDLDNITYTKADKTEGTIENLTEYAKQPQFGLSENVIVNVGASVVDGLLDTVQESGVEALLTQLFALLGMEATSLDEAIDALVASVPAKPADEAVAAETTFWKDENGNLYVNMAGGATISVFGLKESLAFLVDELDRLMTNGMYGLFDRLAEQEDLYSDCTRSEFAIIRRYHCQAVIGILREWSTRDTENLDGIVHTVYRLLRGDIRP